MNIKYGKQIDVKELKGKTIDLFLFAKNHEKRVFTAFDKIKKQNKISNAIGFCYKDFDAETAYDIINFQKISDHTKIYDLLDNLFFLLDNLALTIVVDYSCMTKAWYYSVILYLSKKEMKFKNIIVFFIYTPSKYSEPLLPKPNTIIAPLPGKYHVTMDKPKALIVCLGYEQNKAEGIIEHLDPKLSYLLYTNPAYDNKFVSKLESNNANIIAKLKNVTSTFPFYDLHILEKKLTSLYFSLKDKYSIIIAPLGPKPFTFISMLMSVKYKEIDIWRVGSGSDINEYDREPISTNLFIICEVMFEI